MEQAVCLLFVDNQRFLTFAYNINEVGKTLKKAEKIVSGLEANNSITYYMNRIQAIPLFNAQHQKLDDQSFEMQLSFERQTINFNKAQNIGQRYS